MFNKSLQPGVSKAPLTQRYDSGINDFFAGGVAPAIHVQTPESTPGPSPAINAGEYALPAVLTSPGIPSGGDADEAAPSPIGTPFDSGRSMATPIVGRDIGSGEAWQQGDVVDNTRPGPRPNNSPTGSQPSAEDPNNVLGDVSNE